MISRKLANIIILIAGLLLTSITAFILQQRHTSETQLLMEQNAGNRVQAIQRSIEVSEVIGQSLVNYYASTSKLSFDVFSKISRTYLQEYPFIKALGWNPHINNEDRLRFESTVAQELSGYKLTERSPEGLLVRAKERNEYVPVYFIEPYAGNEKALGYDVASEQTRLRALSYARKHNSPTITGRIKLVQSTKNEWGFLMFFPVYQKGTPSVITKQRPENIAGYMVIVYDIPSLIERSLSYLTPVGLNLTIHDDSAPERERFLHRHLSPKLNTAKRIAKRNDWVRSVSTSLEVGNRHWTLVFEPIPKHFDLSPNLEVKLTLLGGAGISLLLFSYLYQTEKREIELKMHKENLEQAVMERTRELRNSNKELESYSYSIAHDLRTPLRAITSFTQIIEESANEKLNEEEKGYLRRVVAAGKNMAELLEAILNVSRISRSKLDYQSIDLSNLCHRIAEQLESAEGCEQQVLWSIEEGMRVQGDPTLMSVVMENLLANALKFCSKEPKREITIGSARENGEDLFFVRDNGVGFNMEHASQLFRVFHRLHRHDEFEGTGVGLATVQRIIERHEGRIWAESTPGKGATFFFTLAGKKPANHSHLHKSTGTTG